MFATTATLATLFSIYLFFPASIGFLVSELCKFRRSRLITFIASTMLLLSVEVGYLFYRQSNPTIEYDNTVVSADEAHAIVAAAKEYNLTIEHHGEFELRRYVFVTKYRVYRESSTSDSGTLAIDAFPIGHRRISIDFNSPTYFGRHSQ